jgi:dihydroflavonol-4-reductase
MKALVTGATGFIGFHVTKVLKEKSFDVIALVRDRGTTVDLQTLDVELLEGDIRDYQSVLRALKGCQQVFHLAADYKLWVPNPKTMYDINVQGTRNVMEAALHRGIEKIVYTSTVGTLAGSAHGRLLNEETPSSLNEMVGYYKKSKYIAEKEVLHFIQKGAPAIIVNPSAPIGPRDRKPTPTGKIIVDFLNGKIPAYLDTGLNFVDVHDVALGHWLASVYGRVGERYILGNKNMTLREFLDTLAGLTGRKPPRIQLPYFPVLVAAYMNEAFSRWLTHKPPKIPVSGVRMSRKYMFFDCSKAISELKMPQSPVENAIGRAADWFMQKKYVNQ